MNVTRVSRRNSAIASCVLVLVMAIVSQPSAAGPAAGCGPGGRPEPALQGQVPVGERLNGNAAAGYWCNLELVGQFESLGYAAFDSYENCVYYADNVSANIDSGVIVLDVSDPSHPRKTDYLTARAMRDPGESLRVNQARGLLVADHYNPAPLQGPSFAADGSVQGPERHRTLAVYDVSTDCTRPELLADVEMPAANGHEGCFQPDGMVYYMSSYTLTPIDLSDPRHPKQLSDPWQISNPGPVGTHGCSVSADGNRAYVTDVYNNQMLILDTSEVQARKPGAQPNIIGALPTPAELQQSTIALTYGDHPYVLLWTEAKYPFKTCVPGQPNFGYPRFVDVADETHPVEVSKIQSEVVLPENCSQIAADMTFQTRGVERGDPFNLAVLSVGGFLYDSHYCATDRLLDPTILACGQTGSGLRVYDIRDPRSPLEIAYYNTGTLSESDPTLDWAAAPPVMRPDLGQIWWVTVGEGFRAAQFRSGVWPFPDEA